MLVAGTQVQVHYPGVLPDATGRLVGFYTDEPCRVLVRLASGESVVVLEADVAAVSD